MTLRKLVHCLFLFLCFRVVVIAEVLAQVQSPDHRHLFKEDSRSFKRQQQAKQKSILKTDSARSDDVDVQAAQVNFNRDTNQIVASGGVILSKAGVHAQAEQANVNTASKNATLQGDVVINSADGTISAEKADFNFDSETGSFSSAEFSLGEEAYEIAAAEAQKLSEFEYQLKRSELTTCHCVEGDKPWSLHSSRAHITQDGYAHTYNTWMEFQGLPIFYTPYLAFPVKTSRQSGLLVPEFGFGSKDGFQYKQPIYITNGESSDFTFTPFVATKTRFGAGLDYRQIFSRNNRVDSRLVYSNDEMRDGDLRGTIVDGLFDPTFKEDRFAFSYNQMLTNALGSSQSWAFIADVNYVNDDLFLREIDEPKIGNYNDRYTTSTILARAALGDFALAEIMGEYNQALISDGDLTFQRLPEMTLSTAKSFRPFGFNPYGVKVVARANLNVVRFSRSEGYDGWRYDAVPTIGIPFHIANYFNARLEIKSNQTWYDLADTQVPNSTSELDSSNQRKAYSFKYTMGTGLERVYELEKDNWLTWLTSLGQANQDVRLSRLKHTIEPQVTYTLVPDTAPDSGLPLFDATDRIRARSLVTYGFRSNLYGRFQSLKASGAAIPELSPKLEDLALAESTAVLDDISVDDGDKLAGAEISRRRGQIKSLVSFGIKQAYDFEEAEHDSNPNDPKNDLNRRAASDINSDITFFPSNSFALKFENNYDHQDKQFSSWALSTHLFDDRGDAFRARYTYIDEALSHFEGNAEVKFAERLKFGVYARYDDREHEFLERRAGLRLESSCNCWKLDLGVSEKINPDRQEFGLVLTFNGLGDIAQKFGFGNKN